MNGLTLLQNHFSSIWEKKPAYISRCSMYTSLIPGTSKTNTNIIFVGFVIIASANIYEMPCGNPENKNAYIESSQFSREQTEETFQLNDYDGKMYNEL